MVRRLIAVALVCALPAALPAVGARAEYPGPGVVAPPVLSAVASGRAHTCVLRDTTVWCTGLSGSGQTGATGVTRAVNFEPSLMRDAVSVSAGGDSTCAVGADRSVRCWGLSPLAGLPDTPALLQWGARTEPAVVALPAASAVTVGVRHACALAVDASVWCWGDNDSGQLGNGTRTASLVPVRARVPAAVSVDAGGSHTCALTTKSTVWCWGSNRYHQSGVRSVRPVTVPVRVVAARTLAVSAGDWFTCAVGADAAVRCWGRNNSSQLGVPRSGSRRTPVRVHGRGYSSVTAGDGFACAVRTTGSTWCWGTNTHGQLANGGWSRKWYPQKVLTRAGVGPVTAVSAGARHACALTSTPGAMWCWGDGTAGQLGDSAALVRATGTPVWSNGVRLAGIGTDASARVVMTADISCDTARRVASGEGPDGPLCGDAWVADLTETLAPDATVAIGDIQYEAASLAELRSYYEVSWSGLARTLYPVRGNHEYITPGAAGHVEYFGAASAGYWWADMGGWRLFAVDSWCLGQLYAGCSATSPQAGWLAAQLDAARGEGRCTAVVMHHPPFSSGRLATSSALPLWRTSVEHGADLVVTGHDHIYERFARLDADGLRSATGTALFISGMGGAQATPLGSTAAEGSEYRQNTAHGVVEFVFTPRAYTWRFVSAVDSSVMDSGSADCS